MSNLSGKTALVTGASRGMGRACALALAAAGAQVLVHYGRGANEADGVVAEIRKSGGRADAVAADLAGADGPHKLAKLVRDIVGERLDILVANAGITKSASIEETTVEDFDRLFAVNVRAPFFLVQQLLPIMRKGSSIVLSRRSRRMPSSARFRPMPRPRAPSIRWSNISPRCSAIAKSASTRWRPAWSRPRCRASSRPTKAAIMRSVSRR